MVTILNIDCVHFYAYDGLLIPLTSQQQLYDYDVNNNIYLRQLCVAHPINLTYESFVPLRFILAVIICRT